MSCQLDSLLRFDDPAHLAEDLFESTYVRLKVDTGAVGSNNATIGPDEADSLPGNANRVGGPQVVEPLVTKGYLHQQDRFVYLAGLVAERERLAPG